MTKKIEEAQVHAIPPFDWNKSVRVVIQAQPEYMELLRKKIGKWKTSEWFRRKVKEEVENA